MSILIPLIVREKCTLSSILYSGLTNLTIAYNNIALMKVLSFDHALTHFLQIHVFINNNNFNIHQYNCWDDTMCLKIYNKRVSIQGIKKSNTNACDINYDIVKPFQWS